MNPVETEDIVLDIQDLRKSFGKRQVLSGVNLQARRGEIIGIVGENGVGKSTLLKSIVGLLRPDSGNIEIRGSLGYCPQDMLLFESLTVDENFTLFASAYGLNGVSGGDDWEQAK
jgi:ABC-type multidrug transport system ATPase subunit